MSDYKLPDLPSDEDLGITDEDRELFEKEFGDDGPELTAEEMKTLLGEGPGPTADRPKPQSKADARAAKKAEKERRKAERKRQKEERKRQKEGKQREKELAKAAAAGTETDAQRAERIARAAAAGGAARGRAASDGATQGAAAEAAAGAGGDAARSAATVATAERRRWRGLVTLGVIVGVAMFASTRTGLPDPVPASAADTVFSSARAMSMLIEIASDAHPPGSPEHARVRAHLVDRLSSLGLEPEVQTTLSALDVNGVVRAATVRNIVARIPGTDPTGAVLMTAHYDSRGIAVGAADDGVGVVAIVEAIRALRAGGDVRNDIIVLLTDAEELGLLGARAFVDQHPWLDDVAVVLSFEMSGAGGPAIMFETNRDNGWVVRALAEFDPHPFANSMSQTIYDRMPRDTDFTPFKEAGKQGLNFAAIDRAHVYHQAYDTPQRLDESTVQHHGLRALSAARYFGDADLSSVNAPDVVYFTVPGLGLIVYDRIWAYALSAILLLLLAGSLLLAHRSGASLARIGVGLALSLLAAGLAFAAAYVLVGWLPRFHPEAGSLAGSLYHREGWYVLGVAGLTCAAVTGVYAIARRWLTLLELAAGAVVLPTLLAVAVGVAVPLAAMNYQWPALAGLVAVSVVAVLKDRHDGVVGWLTVLLLAVPVIVMLTPLTELVWIALSFRLGAWLVLPIALALFLAVPALEGLQHPNRWWAPATGLVFAAAAVGLGIVLSRPSPERPSPSTLVYLYEHGTGAAVWATDPGADSLDATANAWAIQRAGSTFDGRRDLTGFAYLEGQIPTAPASVASAQPPEVVVTRDSIDGPIRRVTMRVRSRIGAEYVAFEYDGRGSTRLMSMNGYAISDPVGLERAEHWGEPDPAIELELEVTAGQPIGLHVIEHLLRPEELLGREAFARPPNLAPDVTRLSDRAIFRYSVGAFADPRHAIVLPGGQALPGVVPQASVGDTTLVRPDTVEVGPPDTGAVVTSDSVTTSQPDTGTVGLGR